jgi:hypothetical protein
MIWEKHGTIFVTELKAGFVASFSHGIQSNLFGSPIIISKVETVKSYTWKYRKKN